MTPQHSNGVTLASLIRTDICCGALHGGTVSPGPGSGPEAGSVCRSKMKMSHLCVVRQFRGMALLKFVLLTIRNINANKIVKQLYYFRIVMCIN